MSKRTRATVTIVSVVFLIILYYTIFSFSEQDAEASSSLSLRISELCVSWFNSITSRHWTADIIDGMARYFEHPIRKLAHFCEYALMGVLVYMIWRPWMDRPLWRRSREIGEKIRGLKKINLLPLVLIWVFVSAALDEFHQTFIPGRSGNFPDVLLDTSGGLFGCILICLVEILVLRIRFGRKAWKTKSL